MSSREGGRERRGEREGGEREREKKGREGQGEEYIKLKSFCSIQKPNLASGP